MESGNPDTSRQDMVLDLDLTPPLDGSFLGEPSEAFQVSNGEVDLQNPPTHPQADDQPQTNEEGNPVTTTGLSRTDLPSNWTIPATRSARPLTNSEPFRAGWKYRNTNGPTQEKT